MASLYLPAPTRSGPTAAGGKRQGTAAASSAGPSAAAPPPAAAAKPNAPSYEERCGRAAEMARLTPEQRKDRKSRGGGGAIMFVPRGLGDFDDGGAFPEIHVAQYPRHMGNPHLAKKRAGGGGGAAGGGAGGGGGSGGNSNNSNTANTPSGRVAASNNLLSVQVDSAGDISYDALVTGGTNASQKVYARHSDLRGCHPTTDDVALPTDAEERTAAERTMAALGVITSKATEMARPSGSALVQAATSQNIEDKTQFLKYTPREDAPGYNPAARQRVIQMVPKQIDPMQPPKHQHRKAPRGPADDPVPVLHAPPEKLSKEEREAWNIPASISNWKNTRGYTIPLDKRLAADGRGLRDEATINPNFATLSESLYVAERQAREEVRMRATVQKRLAVQEKERREEELRELALRARRERAGQVAEAAVESAAQAGAEAVGGSGGGVAAGVGVRGGTAAGGGNVVPEEGDIEGPPSSRPSGPTDDEVAAQQRERLRQERRRERERELRMEHHRGGGAKTAGEDDGDDDDDNNDDVAVKKRRLEDDRDISEKVALGTHTGTGGAGEVDSRLYNQSAGMDSGFGAEDDYTVYSKPMFDRDGASSSSIYRPTRGEQALDADAPYDQLKSGGITGKFKPDQAFGGADGGGAAGSAGPRNAPVQFEKDGEK